jgi:hypothetical protein
MLFQGQVGPQAGAQSMAPGSVMSIRLGNLGEQIASELHGRYYEQTYRRNVFNGAVVGQVTTVGLAATYTGLCLSNPIGSQVNLVLLQASYAFIVAFPAGSVIGLMTGYNSGTNVTHTTPVTPRNQFFGAGGSGVGLLDSSATLPTAPTLNTILGSGFTGAITTTPHVGPSLIDIAGSIILPAGAYCAFYTSTVSGAAGGAFSFIWEEVPV